MYLCMYVYIGIFIRMYMIYIIYHTLPLAQSIEFWCPQSSEDFLRRYVFTSVRVQCILMTSFSYLWIAKSFTHSCLKGVVKEAEDVRCCLGVVRVCVCACVLRLVYPHLRESTSVYLYIHMFI